MISKFSISPALISWYNQKKLPNIMHFKHDLYTGYRIAQLLNLILGKKFPLTSFFDETSTKVAKNNWERILFYQKELNLPLKLNKDLIQLIIDKDPQECERQILECLINIYEFDTKIPYPRQTISACPRSIVPQVQTRGGFGGTVMATQNEEDDQEEGMQYPKNVPIFCRRSYVNCNALINHLNNACTGALSSVDSVADQIEMLDPRVDCCYPFPNLVLHLPPDACKEVCKFLLQHLDNYVIIQHILIDFNMFYDVACLILHSVIAFNQVSGDALEIFDLAADKLCTIISMIKATHPSILYMIYNNIIMGRLFKELPLINFSLVHMLQICFTCIEDFTYPQIEEWFNLSVKNLRLYQPYVNENRLRFEVVMAFIIFTQRVTGIGVEKHGSGEHENMSASVSQAPSTAASQQGARSITIGSQLDMSQASQTNLIECVCRLSMKCCKCSEILPETERYAAFDLIVRTICLNHALHETLDFVLFKILYSFVNHLRPQQQNPRMQIASRTSQSTSLQDEFDSADMCTLVFNRNGRNFKLKFTYDKVNRLNFDQIKFIVVALSQLRVVHNYNFQQSINSFLQGLGYVMLNNEQYSQGQYLLGVMLVVKNQKDLIYTIAQSLHRNLIQPLDEKELSLQKNQLKENRILKSLLLSMALQSINNPKWPCRVFGILTREKVKGQYANQCYKKPYYKQAIYSYQQFDQMAEITKSSCLTNSYMNGSHMTQQSGRGKIDQSSLQYDSLQSIVPQFVYDELLTLAEVIDPEGYDIIVSDLSLLVGVYIAASGGISSQTFKALFQLILVNPMIGVAALQFWPDALFGSQLSESQILADTSSDIFVLVIAAIGASDCLPSHLEKIQSSLITLLAITFGPTPIDNVDKQIAQEHVFKMLQKLMRDPSGLDVLKSIFAMPDMECYGNEKLEGLVAEVLHGTIPSE